MSTIEDADMGKDRKTRERLREDHSNSDVVIIGCKIPNGLILDEEREIDYNEPIMGGGIYRGKRWVRTGVRYTLNGPAVSAEQFRSGDIDHLVIRGAALTTGIPREFWENWLKRHKDNSFVKQRLVFAAADEGSARSMAAELAKVKSGLEPIDPDHPNRFRSDVSRVRAGTTSDATEERV